MGSFWKAACAYAARVPDSANAFLRHPFTEKADDGLVVKLLIQRSDAGWKGQAIRKLGNDSWVSSDVIGYLDSLDLPETRKALEEFTGKMRKKQRKPSDPAMDGGLYALRDIEGLRTRKRMAELPIR